ncbi:MAG: DUF433 domain-containing protein [Ardenticatenaceae bacterium]|nr:DUF433 domain-containing protein [Ardenticatenaceae bacterium]
MVQPNVIRHDREILGGTSVLAGTRVLVQTLLDYLEGGQSPQEVLDDFPTVERDQAIAVLEQLKHILLNQSRKAVALARAATRQLNPGR